MPRHGRFPGRCRSFTYEVRPPARLRLDPPAQAIADLAERRQAIGLGTVDRLPRLIARRHHGVEWAAGQAVHALAPLARDVDPDLVHDAHRLRTQAAAPSCGRSGRGRAPFEAATPTA